MQRSDVKIFETIGRRSLTTASALIKIDAVLDVLAKRPGTLEANVFDEHGGILASGDPGVIGTIDTDPRIADVIRTGDAYAGHEGDPQLDPRDFEFIAPVELPTGRYAYEVTYDHASFDAELAAVRRALLLVGGGGLVAGVALFYVLGGRNVIRRHRSALARATRDGMTDLPNQRAFHDELPHAISAAARYDEPLALVMLDIDDFKKINDRWGHPVGDVVLRGLVEELTKGVREMDTVARYGGEEFALIFPETTPAKAWVVADRLRKRVASRLFTAPHVEQALAVTISLGLATYPEDGSLKRVLIERADQALYQAKRSGKNCLVTAASLADLKTL
jgi:diguanylate cyclase (GGDEF)-like protein